MARNYIMKKIKYTNHPDFPAIKNVRIVDDFLPRPEDLVTQKTTRKVTIALDIGSIQYFKEKSKKLNEPYQRVIRNLLQKYSQQVPM